MWILRLKGSRVTGILVKALYNSPHQGTLPMGINSNKFERASSEFLVITSPVHVLFSQKSQCRVWNKMAVLSMPYSVAEEIMKL